MNYAVISTIIFFVSTLYYWRRSTAVFLRSLGDDSSFHLGTMMGDCMTDFISAMFAARKQKVKPPLGVYLHGATFFAIPINVLILWILQ